MIDIPNNLLASLSRALADVGDNRLGTHAVRFARFQIAVGKALDDYNKMRNERIKAYCDTGYKDPADAPAELLEELNALAVDTTDIDAKPIPSDVLDSVNAKPNSLAVLFSIDGVLDDG